MTLSSPLIGEWIFRGKVGGGRDIGGALRFWNANGRLAGAYLAPNGREAPLTNPNLEGPLVTFGITGTLGTWKLSGVLSNDQMTGTFETISGVVPWTAIRGVAPAPRPASPQAPPPPTATPERRQ